MESDEMSALASRLGPKLPPAPAWPLMVGCSFSLAVCLGCFCFCFCVCFRCCCWFYYGVRLLVLLSCL